MLHFWCTDRTSLSLLVELFNFTNRLVLVQKILYPTITENQTSKTETDTIWYYLVNLYCNVILSFLFAFIDQNLVAKP